MSEEKKELEVLWTPQQVATYLNLTRTTIYKWISEGTMFEPSKLIRFSNRVRIPRSEVERLAGSVKKELENK